MHLASLAIILCAMKDQTMRLISSLSLYIYFYLNLLLYHRNIFGFSLKVFNNLRKFLENVWQHFVWPLNKLWRNLWIVGNLQKIIKNALSHIYKCNYLKERTLHVSSKIHDCINFLFLWQEQHMYVLVFWALKLIHIFSSQCNILFSILAVPSFCTQHTTEIFVDIIHEQYTCKVHVGK